MRKLPWLCLVCVLACSPTTPDPDPGYGPIGGDRRTGGDSGGGGDTAGGDPGFNPSAVCGNNQLNGLETCDGHAREYESDCATLNAGAGTTTCTSGCVVNMAPCTGDACAGNGYYNNGKCDACDLAGGSTDPDCAAECGANSNCADYYDDMLGVWTCAHAGFGRDPDCPQCGDGVQTNLDPELYAEWCDGNDFGGWGCENYNFDGGTLDCTNDCLVDTSGCYLINVGSDCGDGLATGYEPCEPGSDDCGNYGFGSGTMVCTPGCEWNLTGCSNADVCGGLGWYDDGRCDPCELLGGTADADCSKCAADGDCAERFNVELNVWSCQTVASADPDCGVCGNNVREESEHCDGKDTGDIECTDSVWGYSSGEIGCNPDCTLNFSRCIP